MASTLTGSITQRGGRPSSAIGERPRERPAQPGAGINVGDTERWLSLAGGTVLGLYGLSRRSPGGLALAAVGGALAYRGATGHCSVYQSLGVNTAGRRGPATAVPAGRGVKVEMGFTVNRPAADLYRFFRDFENLGRILSHVESVRVTGNRSHWVARGPLGFRPEWDAEVFNERENELIAWRSLPGSEIETAGSIHFTPAPGGHGTEVRVSLKYNPPAGKAGILLAGLFGEDPESVLREDLRRFKQLMETGEIATTEGQPHGTCR
jgi:uncharacterized membrane protein